MTTSSAFSIRVAIISVVAAGSLPFAGPASTRSRPVWQRSDVLSFAWSSDGQKFATGMKDGRVVVWDANRLVALQQLRLHNSWVSDVGWSQDDRLLVATSYDRTISVWDVGESRIRYRLSDHTDFVYSLAWNPQQSNVAATSADDKTVRVWDLATAKSTATLQHEKVVEQMGWSADGGFLATYVSGGKTVLLWRNGSDQVFARLGNHRWRVTDIRWSPVGSLLAVGGFDFVELWEGPRAERLTTLRHNEITRDIEWSSDGRRMAASTGAGTVLVWGIDPASGEARLQRRMRPDAAAGDEFRPILAVAWASSGEWLAACRLSRTYIWDTRTWIKQTFNETGGPNLSWRPSGSRLAVWGDARGRASIWDVTTDLPPD